MSRQFMDLYGSPSCRHHHPRASPPNRTLTLPQPASFSQPFSIFPSRRSAPSPPGSRRGPGSSAGRGHGTGGTRRARRLAPALQGAERCRFGQSAWEKGAGLLPLMAGAAVAAAEWGAAGGECGWLWARGVEGVGPVLAWRGWAGDAWPVPAVLWDVCEEGVWVGVSEVSGGSRLVVGVC